MRTKEQDRERKKKERKLRSHSQVDRKHWLKKAYKMSPEQYHELFLKAQGACEICGIIQEHLDYHLCVDHNHNTGQIRGLLCKKCNQGIGMFSDDLFLLERACGYLDGKQHSFQESARIYSQT